MQWVTDHSIGEAFSTADLTRFGTRASVDQALSRLVKKKCLLRLARGIFITPSDQNVVRTISPVESALGVISRRSNCAIQVSGTEAVKCLNIPVEPISNPDQNFQWVAKPRRLTIAGKSIHIRSTSPRKVALCGRPAGLAVTAIWQIGRPNMTSTIMTTIINSLSPEERRALRESAAALPAWAREQMPDVDVDVVENMRSSAIIPKSIPSRKFHDVRNSETETARSAFHDDLDEDAIDSGKRSASAAEGRWSGFGPYYAMFPVDFARQVIARYCPPGGAVMDPFCGRGTVPFVALATGREGLACDINPVAWIYAKTKTDPYPDPQVVLRRARKIYTLITRNDRRPKNEFQELAWSRDVLGFLNAARRELNWKGSRIDRTLMGILLVHLHAKLGNGISNQMRQSKAMAPEYSVKWWREKEMLPPEIDILAYLEDRLEWRYKMGVVENAEDVERPTILLGDARTVLRRTPKAFEANLILTSPPYYGVTNYRYDNWIRLWLLGEGPTLPQTDAWARHGNKEEYRELLNRTFTVCKKKSTEDAVIYVRTDARKFTLESTVDVLRGVWPDKRLYFAFDGFKKATQTALFGDKELKPGEVDLLLLPSDHPIPIGMQLIEVNTYPNLPTNDLSK
nr:DUF6088 family protein [Herbaspirillum rubrisubalbicans]